MKTLGIALVVALAATASSAAADRIDEDVTISSLLCHEDNHCTVYFPTVTQFNGFCGRADGNAMSWDATTAAGQNIQKLVLAAFLAGKTIRLANYSTNGARNCEGGALQVNWAQLLPN